MHLKDTPVIVTGGGSGMGAETARHLAKAGAKIAVFDVAADRVQHVAQEIGGLACVCDVSNAESVEDAIAAVRREFGPARIVVNCAGVATPGRIVGKEGPLALDAFRRVIEINLIGTFNVLRLAAAEMQNLEPNGEGERGVIINTASVAAFEGQIGQAAYAASKGGIVGLTLPAARELARAGIRVMTIAPGLIETPMFEGLGQDVYDSLIAATVFPKRLGYAQEYARLVLAIIDNPLLNGETIRLDGAVRLGVK